MHLPQEFTEYTSDLFGPQRWQRFLRAFDTIAQTSVRLNPWKCNEGSIFPQMTPVPWCQHGYWLKERPDFTLDPLLHGGVYYV